MKLERTGNSNISTTEDENSSTEERNNTKFSTSNLIKYIIGSPRHLRKLTSNALHVLSTHDKPHIFLTLTCNSKWSEIDETVKRNQTALCGAEITNFVFHQRLQTLIDHFKKKCNNNIH